MTKEITPLKPELANKIYTVIQDEKPLDALLNLANILNKPIESSPFDEKTHEELLQIFNTNQEQLLLHFATYSPENFDRLNLIQPLDDEHYIVTSLATDTSHNLVVYSYIKRYDSDVEFDLLVIDRFTYPNVSTYLYGNPYSEEWTEKSIIHFDKIKEICDGVKEHDRNENNWFSHFRKITWINSN